MLRFTKYGVIGMNPMVATYVAMGCYRRCWTVEECSGMLQMTWTEATAVASMLNLAALQSYTERYIN